jgi:hypothetical protein
MTETKTYNGWTNYETWAVNLWMGNDQGSYSYYNELAESTWKAARARPSTLMTRKECAARDLSDLLKDEFEEGKDNLLEQAKLTSSVWADLLGAALSEVDWHEIANALLEDFEEEAEEPSDEA